MLFSSTSRPAATLKLLAKALHHAFLGCISLFLGYGSITVGVMRTKFADKLEHASIYF
jgi:hypothetical protein